MSTRRLMELVKVAELTEQLQAEGYTVASEKQPSDIGIDFIASKGTEVIAYEVKAASNPPLPADVLTRLQAALRERKFTELRVVVVQPELAGASQVHVDGLEDALLVWLLGSHVPELDELSGCTVVDSIGDVEIATLDAFPSRIRAEGIGTVTVELNFDGGTKREGLASTATLPMAFDAHLSPSADGKRFTVDRVARLEIDTSVLYEND